IGADEKMIVPFQRVMINGHVSYFILIAVTYGISLFFWPTPAVPLVGAILIPVAIRAGLPPIGAGIAISLAGQGMALSSDYVIQIAPTLSASAANLDVTAVADRALVLSLVTGFFAIGLAYLFLRKSILRPNAAHLRKWEESGENEEKGENLDESTTEKESLVGKTVQKSKWFAIIVPITFLIVVIFMGYTKFSGTAEMEGGAGAALIGGMALLLLIAATATFNVKGALERVSNHIIEGLVFAFKAMGIVLPIAGFFFLGNDETAIQILGTGDETPAFLFDLILAGEQFIPAQ